MVGKLRNIWGHGPAVCLAVLVLTAGCVTLPSGQSETTPTPAELEAQVDDAVPPDAATATLVSERGGTVAYTETIWMRDDGATRTETSDGLFRHVNDGERAWFYDVGADRVTVLDANRTPDSHFSYLYEMQRQYFDELTVTAIEESTIDDRETYHVTFQPPRDETVGTEITVLVGDTEFVIPLETGETDGSDDAANRIDVWIDRETLFPVKQRLETDDGTRTWTYIDVSFGDDIPDERFAFDPPADAVVEQEVHPYGHAVDSVAAAESRTNLTVAEPTALPDGLERESVDVASYLFGDATAVKVRYTDDDRRAILASTTTVRRLPEGAGETVSIDGRSVTTVETEFGTQLEWTCGDRVIYLFATEGVEPETALSVAESIACAEDPASTPKSSD